MLEHAGLWLAAAAPSAPGGRPPGIYRTIHDADTRDWLGHAVWPRPGGPRWLHWLFPGRCLVYEAPDESLVFAAGRSWRRLGVCVVRDADDHEIGVISGAEVLSPSGKCLAVPRLAPNGGTYHSPEGDELARWDQSRDGTRLEFTQSADDPLLRMALLASVLEA